MSTNELITVVALLAGPVLAVFVQIGAERRNQLRDAQTTTFRMLVGTRHLVGDPAYSTAINMTPIDFNRVSKVMGSYREYIEAIRYKPTPENSTEHEKVIVARQTRLIFEMSQYLGYDIPESEIQTNPYAAGGFIARDNLMLSAWESWPRIAVALEMQTSWIQSQQDGASK